MIRLVHFQESDFDQLIEWIYDEEILIKWCGSLFKFPLTRESLSWYIKSTNIVGESEAFVYKAIDEEGNVVGHISLGGLSYKNRSARVTRVLVGNNAQRGKGCCQSMIKEILKVAFEELKLHRVSLGVYNDNEPALKCYLKTGFVIEGINRDVLWYKEKWWSLMEMSILENEWRTLHTANV